LIFHTIYKNNRTFAPLLTRFNNKMEIFREIGQLTCYLKNKRLNGKKIGLVPTMGAFHEGHLTLVKRSVKENDITVCSIFVNPTQFNNPEDLEKYPRNVDKDIEMLKANCCDVVFCPEVSTMYRKERIVQIRLGYLEEIMEGKFRPGHFQGVGLIVTKLLNIVKPDRAYFGLKDLQQFVLVKKLVEELNIDVEICGVPTVRNEKGLALSSRNERLSEREKEQALIFNRSLRLAQEMLKNGGKIKEVRDVILKNFQKDNSVKLEYFEIVDSETLRNIDSLNDCDNASLCIAGYVGKVRLIDNISIN